MLRFHVIFAVGAAFLWDFVSANDAVEAQVVAAAPAVNETHVKVLAADQKSQPNVCCTILGVFLGSEIFTSGAQYQNSLKSYWSQQEQSISPKCVVVPKTPKDVATSLVVLSVASKYVKNGCPFAVRGGG